ncbi:hypothetical protein KUTeg_020873 [Tegillarca granosa]|uniref:Sialate O-acetylesterase domain-containing protein n=1 Tax=Tegillarca granosa TaxID=220873 RepID=A0ABQ9EDG5_TEGGR|nr:hypothetical protein KUTeg_020873 [Tegillarca granosa]
MVLQKDNPVIWGYSNNVNDVIHIKINGAEVGHSTVQTTSETGHSGVWQVKFSAPAGGYGPYTITAQSGSGSLTLRDVLFGDVWICSGQSNMEFFVNKVRFQNSMSLFSAVCWLYGKLLYQHLNYPIGLVESNYGGTRIEAWSSPDAMAACPTTGKRATSRNDVSVLWNGMINPLLRNTIYGAIWYQGESNAGYYQQYSCQFPAMISDWRQKFNQASLQATSNSFPFGWQRTEIKPFSTGMAGLRWAQTANQGQVPNPKLQNVFMAVGMDLPDFDSPYGTIHPRYKHTIAQRLVLAGYAVAYNHRNVNYHGPFPSSYHYTNSTHRIQIEFDHGTNPIEVRSNDGFDVCCAPPNHACSDHDRGWRISHILSHDTTHVYIDTSMCKQHGLTSIGGVRYAWRESPCPFQMCALYGVDNGLPTPPFIHSAAL